MRSNANRAQAAAKQALVEAHRDEYQALYRKFCDEFGVKPRSLGAPCGTPAAYAGHKRKDEAVDDACIEAMRAYVNEQYRLRNPIVKRFPVECGTRAGYQKHTRLKEPACAACKHANVEYVNAKNRDARALTPSL